MSYKWYLLWIILCGFTPFVQARSLESGASKNNVSVVTDSLAESIGPDYHKAALVNVELGLGYLEQGQIARAKTKFTRAVKLAPTSPEVRSAMAYFWEMTGEYKDSEKSHKKAIRLARKQSGAALNNYGAFLCRRARFTEADRAFHSALQDKEYARTAEVYENAGLCARQAGQTDKAMEYFKTALVRDPHAVKVLVPLAHLSLESQRLDEAQRYLQRYRAIAEPTAQSLWVRIQVARARHDQNAVASQALLLKNLFEHSPEYTAYLESERTLTVTRSDRPSQPE